MSRRLDRLLPPDDQRRVVEAIRAAEKTTSGEIKVHVEARCRGGDAYARAVALFGALGLTRTRERNAVLLYVATRDRRFAVLGDAGIHEEVGSQFWAEAIARMGESFGRGALGDGLCAAIAAIGARLAQRFPPRPDDKNEIDDSISS
jgi:uncharacterized membrane protein